jgi:hypothetical protein
MVWAMPPDEFGAWGQWAGALGSFLAVGVALGLAIWDARRRDREARDQLAAQARTVTARLAKADEPDVPKGFTARKVDVIVVENHGTLPVTNVVIHAAAVYHEPTVRSKWQLWTGAHWKGEQEAYLLAMVLGPGQSVSSPQIRFGDIEEQTKLDLSKGMVDFTFVDATGLGWRRVANAQPQRYLTDFEKAARWWTKKTPRGRWRRLRAKVSFPPEMKI